MTLSQDRTNAEQDQRITETIRQEGLRLRNFIRRRVANADDAEDLIQDIFYELVLAYRLMKPIEDVAAWLFWIARNRIIDRFRKKQREAYPLEAISAEPEGELSGCNVQGEVPGWEDLLPSTDAGPEAAYARSILLEKLDEALDELPADQREVFLAHEIEGRSFRDLAAETGVSVNALLSRKHYAVVHLRRRLRVIYEEFANEWGRSR